MAREYGYSVVPPKAEWQKLSVEVEKSLMKRFREVVQQRGMKLKYALSEALSDYIEKWKKAKEK